MSDDIRSRLLRQYQDATGRHGSDAVNQNVDDATLAFMIVRAALLTFDREVANTPDLEPWEGYSPWEALSVIDKALTKNTQIGSLPMVEQVAILIGVPSQQLRDGLGRCPDEVAQIFGVVGQREPDRSPSGDEAGVLELVANLVRELDGNLAVLPAGLQHVAWGALASMADYMHDAAS